MCQEDATSALRTPPGYEGDGSYEGVREPG